MLHDDRRRLATSLFQSPEWAFVAQILADMDRDSVRELRLYGGASKLAAERIRVVNEIRGRFRAVAMGLKMEDPFSHVRPADDPGTNPRNHDS